MWFSAICFAVFPLAVLYWLGLGKMIKWILVVYLFLILQAVGFASGLLFNCLFHDSDWWHKFQLPHMYMDGWIESARADQFWKMMLAPYIFVFDMVLVYIKFNFTMGNIVLFFPEVLCLRFFFNYLIRFGIITERQLSPKEIFAAKKSEEEEYAIRRERMSKEPGYMGFD
jgi:hypothetical protein